MLNITLGEIDRPQLLTRTFDRNYLVKYLGIDTFTVYDGLKTAKNNQARSNADSSDLNKVISYTQKIMRSLTQACSELPKTKTSS